jgi:hypothetical protein
MSYRTRHNRDPVSSKPLSALDSGQSLRDFRNDGICTSVKRIVTCTTILANRKRRAINGPEQDLSIELLRYSLDDAFPKSYLSNYKEKLMDIFYPPAYFLSANMDKKYPL